jgi:glycosyltransferase involved in cell wall biosynthesis
MKFSIVICTYNYAHLLPDTLRTVAAQTLKDFELLIVDDGSTDNTEKVVEQFRPLFRDFHYVKKAHTGPTDTRNTGARTARGTHIAFLDADDLWSTHYLSTMQRALDSNPQAGVVLCEAIIIRSDDGVVTEAALHRALPAVCGPVRSPRELFDVILAFSPSGMVLSKDLYDRTGPFDVETFGWFSEDIDWMFRALMAGAFCVCLKQRLYLYRRHEDNLTNKGGESFRSWLKIYSQTLKDGCKDPQVEALARGVIRRYSVRFLPTCSISEGRLLLRNGIQTLGGDPWVRFCYMGTYVGLVSLLKLLKQIKRSVRRLFQRKLAVDLSASSEAVFDAVKD